MTASVDSQRLGEVGRRTHDFPSDEQFVIEKIAAGFGPPFRGEIWDYARHIELGSSYEVPAGNLCRQCAGLGRRECRHFEIETARQLVGPFKAIADPNVQTVMVLKATQTLGSLWWDLTLHFLIVHSDYSTFIVFLESDDKALSYCDKRLMPTLKANPDIAPLLPSGPDRFDNTKTDIRFTNGKLLRVCGLNDSNASSLTWQVVVIDEGWLHGADGLMQKAIDRSKQVARRKVLIVGQAGKKDEDQDRIWRRLYQVRLTWACPCCGGRQGFGEYGPAVQRADDFVPVQKVPGVKCQVSGEEKELPFPPTPPAPGTYAGLKVAKRLGELADPAEIKRVAAAAVLECVHCGFEIPDTPVMRRALMASYEQNYQPNGYTPPNFEVGFWNPDPASITIPFAQTMQEYLVAKLDDEQLGNRQTLQNFYQNRWAMAWNPDLGMRAPERLPLSLDYDTAAKIPGELGRIAAVDFQFNGTHLPYQAWAIGDGVPPRLLHWEWIKPLAVGLPDAEAREFCKTRVRELNRQFGIEQQNLMVDAGHRPDLVREWAAEDHVLGRIKSGHAIRQKIITYGLLLGDDRLSYRWDHPGRKHTLERFKRKEPAVLVDIVKAGKRLRVPVQHQLWSNPSIKEIAKRWRDGDGAPKIEVHERFLQDKSKQGFWAQMNAERLLPWKGRPGKSRWDNEDRPNHAWDGWCMVMVRMDQLGLLNHFGPPQEDE